jgi:hypothetical protein
MTLHGGMKGQELPHSARFWHEIIQANRIAPCGTTPLATAAASSAGDGQQSPATLVQRRIINTTRKHYH